MTDRHLDDEIRSTPRPACYLCGSRGVLLYQRLPDRLFDASGEWSFRRCPNPRCRLVWLDPMPIEADIGRAYRTYFTHRSSHDGSSPETGPPGLLRHEPRPVSSRLRAAPRSLPRPLRRRYLRLRCDAGRSYLQARYGYPREPRPRWHCCLAPFVHLLPSGRDAFDFAVGYLPPPAAGARWLDVGCGDGEQLASMRRLGWEVVGVDADPHAVRVCRSRGLPVRLGGLAEQAFPEDHFDALYLSHVIEHLHDPVALLRECRRILKPGGVLVVLTPNVQSWGHAYFRSHWLHLDPPRHQMLFSPPNLRAAVEKAELSVTTLRTSARPAAMTWEMSSAIRRSGRSPLDLEQGMAARLVPLLERALMLLRPEAGEKILLIARRAVTPEAR